MGLLQGQIVKYSPTVSKSIEINFLAGFLKYASKYQMQSIQYQGVMCKVKSAKFLTVFEINCVGQDNDFVNSSYSLTLFEVYFRHSLSHYLHAIPFEFLCHIFASQKLYKFTCCLQGIIFKLS